MPDTSQQQNFTIQEYGLARQNKDSLDEQTNNVIMDSFSKHEFSVSDYDYMLKNFNLPQSQQMTVKAKKDELNKTSKIKQLYGDTSLLVNHLPKNKQLEWQIQNFGKDGNDEKVLKQINAMHYAEKLGKPLQEIMDNYDQYRDSYHNADYGGLIDDTTAFNQIKDTYYPDSLTNTEAISVGYAKMKGNWNRSTESETHNSNAFWAIGQSDEEIDRVISERTKSRNKVSIALDGDNAFTNSFYGAVGMGAQVAGSWQRGAEYGTAAAAGVAVAGQLGPQVALPEEIFTVPGAFAVGYGAGSFEYWAEQGTGAMYMDMVEMGIPKDIAKSVSVPMGLVYAGIERIGALDKLPLLKGGSVATNGITETMKAKLLIYLKEVAKESSEEGAQEAVNRLAQKIGYSLTPEEQQQEVDLPTIKQDLEASLNATLDSVGPIMWFGGGHFLSDNTFQRSETQQEADKREAVHKGFVKQQIDTIQKDVESSIQVTDAEGKEVVDPDIQTKNMLLGFLNKNKDLSQMEFAFEMSKLNTEVGLKQPEDMSRVELKEELGLTDKTFATDTTLRKMVYGNRDKFIMPEAAKTRLKAYIARNVDLLDAMPQEEVEAAFSESVQVVLDKQINEKPLTELDQGILDINDATRLGRGKFSLDLKEKINELQQKSTISTITETDEEAQSLFDRAESEPLIRGFIDYLGATTGREIVATGKESFLVDFVQDEIISEEEALQAIVDSGKAEGIDVDLSLLEKVAVNGYTQENVANIARTGNITTVLEENAELYYNEALLKDTSGEFRAMIKRNRNAYNKAVGEKTAMSNLEWFSDRAIDFALGNKQLWKDADTNIKSIFSSLAELANQLVKRMATTFDLIKKGDLDADFKRSLQETLMPGVESKTNKAEVSFQLDVKDVFMKPNADVKNKENWNSNERKLLTEEANKAEAKFNKKENMLAHAKLLRVSSLARDLEINKDDILARTQDLIKYAKKWLPAEIRGKSKFLSQLTKLQQVKLGSKVRTVEAVFNEALAEVKKLVDEYEISQLKDNFKELVNKPKRKMSEESLTEIKAIEEVSKYNADKIAEEQSRLVSSTDTQADQDLNRLSTFGGLNMMDAAALAKAVEALKDIVETDKITYQVKEQKKQEKVAGLIDTFVDDITNGQGLLDKNQAKRSEYMENSDDRAKQEVSKMLLSIQSVDSLTDIASNKRTDNMYEGEMTQWLARSMQVMDDTYSRNLREVQKDIKVRYQKYFGVEQGTLEAMEEVRDSGVLIDGAELKLSYADTITLKMQTFNEKGIGSLKEAGIAQEQLAQLDIFMNKAKLPTDLTLEGYALDLLDFYNKYYERVNKVYKAVYNIDLPKEEMYSPLKIYTQSDVSNTKLIADGGSRATLLNQAFMTRIDHKLQAKLTNVDAFQILTQHVTSMENFIAKAEGMKEIRDVMQSQDIKNAIEQEVGGKVNTAIKSALDRYEVGPLSSEYNITSMNRLVSNYTKARIGGKIGSFSKQMASMIAFTINMPTTEWIKGMSNFISNPELIAERVSELKNTEFMRERGTKGIDSAMRTALEQGAKAGLVQETIENKITHAMMAFTRAGDMLAIVSGGWALYDYKKREYIADGMSEADAKEKALVDFEIATARMQQSGKSKDIGAIQETGNSLVKLFTLFQNSQFAYWRVVQTGWRNLRKGRGSKAQNLKAIAVAGFVLPMAFATMSLANKATWAFMMGGLDDDDEQEAMNRAFWSIVSSPFTTNPIPFLGDVSESVGSAMVGNYAPYVGKLPFIGETYKAGKFMNSVYSGEFLDTMRQAAAISGDLIGMPVDTMLKNAEDIYEAADK